MARLTSNGVQFNLADASDSINSYYWMYPAGTRKLFWEASAPTGWTQLTDAAYDNKSLRVVTGTGGGSGGTFNFTTVLSTVTDITITVNNTEPILPPSGIPKVVGDHTLSIAELPEHSHEHLLGRSWQYYWLHSGEVRLCRSQRWGWCLDRSEWSESTRALCARRCEHSGPTAP